jgi:ribonuclease HI
VALIHIRASRPGKYLIVTDSMMSLKALQTRRVAPRTHSLVYEIKEAFWWLKNNEYEIHMNGNERADQLAGGALKNDMK